MESPFYYLSVKSLTGGTGLYRVPHTPLLNAFSGQRIKKRCLSARLENFSKDVKRGRCIAMTNEELVAEIRSGLSVTDNMQLLYESNLPLIKQYVRPYSAFESMEDLLQESYFGLLSAVQHYESSENVKFMTYAEFWIKQSVQRYLEKCGSLVRIPSYIRQKITCYKRTVQELEQILGRTPTDNEIADKMRISAGMLQELKMQTQGVGSLDTSISDDDSLTLSDTLQVDFSLENEVIDKVYSDDCKGELWDIVERFTSIQENRVIKEYFINQKTIAQISEESGLSLDCIRQIKEKGLRRLRIGKARRELLQKFDDVASFLYLGTLKNFREHDFSSVVERFVVQRTEKEERYKQHSAEVEKKRKRGCSKMEYPASGD